jgi:hypothetical protein
MGFALRGIPQALPGPLGGSKRFSSSSSTRPSRLIPNAGPNPTSMPSD